MATGIDPQGINVGTMCGVGAIIHEIGHAVGLYHEQSRNDRNGFVRVFLGNVQPGREHNFNMYGGAGFEVGDYDHGSLMHYGCGFFRADGAGNTLAPTTPGVTCADLGGGVLPLRACRSAGHEVESFVRLVGPRHRGIFAGTGGEIPRPDAVGITDRGFFRWGPG